MAEINYLPSTLLMGLFLIAILVTLVSVRDWRGASANGGERSTAAELPRVSSGDITPRRTASESATPTSWVVGFLLLVVIAGAGVALFVGGASIPSMSTQAIGIVLALVLGGLVGGYLTSGVYLSARSHGRGRSEATAVALWILGVLLIGVIAAKLIMAQ